MKHTRGLIIVILAVICIISGVVSARNYFAKRQAEAEYEKLRELVSITETDSTKEAGAKEPLVLPEESDFESANTETDSDYQVPQGLSDLMNQNQSVIGWIKINDTKIDYPIMQNVDDNEYYLHRDINGEKSYPGSIYLDSNHRINDTGLHVIYGHNMKNGSMFKDVTKFTNPEYLKTHQNVTIYTGEKEINLVPVYCYVGSADGSYRNTFNSPEELEEFLYETTGEKISGNIFVLITCSYGSDDERTYCILREEI